MIYEGLKPFPQATPFVELYTKDDIIDLHNWGDFESVTYGANRQLVFNFSHDASWGGLRSRDGVELWELTFFDTSHLRVVSDEDSGTEPSLLEEILCQPAGPHRDWIEIRLGGGTTFEFQAAKVSIYRVPTRGGASAH